MINEVTLIGNLGKDADTRSIGDSTVTDLTVATSESYKDVDGEWQSKTEWHNVVIWKASNYIQNLKKGDQIFVKGSISYQKAETDGVVKYYTKIKARQVRALAGNKTTEKSGEEIDLPF